MAFKTIYSVATMAAYNGFSQPMTQIPFLDGETIKIMNFTKYGLALFANQEQIDIIQAYSYLILPNSSNYFVQMEAQATSQYYYPYSNVSVRSISGGKDSYTMGPLIQLVSQSPGDTVNVAGSMTISNTPQVNINNVPAVTLSGTNTVNIGNTPSFNIANVPSVVISGTANMNIATMPAVSIAGGVNATIQNASLNSNITNAQIITNGLTQSNTATLTISNLAPGASATYFGTLLFTMGFYSGYVAFTNAAGNNTYNANIALNANFPNGYIQSHYTNGTIWPVTNSIAPFNDISAFRTTLLSHGDIFITNTGNSTIVNDTVKIQIFLVPATVIDNQSNQPIPISNNYYGTGADGVFTTTSGAYSLSNPANAPAIYNFKSLTVNSGTTLQFANLAKYGIIYSQGDITINGTLYAPSAVTNEISPNPLSINGKQLLFAGNGGAGGNATSGSRIGTGGAGGTGNAYTSGAGGGGAGGYDGTSGAGGGTGYGNLPGGSSGGASATSGTTGVTDSTATLCLVAGGTITINGSIIAAGVAGGSGGSDYATGPGGTVYGGGGGSCGPNKGGSGVAGEYYNGAGLGKGGGAGGAGGAVVLLYAGGSVIVSGTVNVAAGAGGSPGGQAGQAGAIQIFQYGGTLGT